MNIGKNFSIRLLSNSKNIINNRYLSIFSKDNENLISIKNLENCIIKMNKFPTLSMDKQKNFRNASVLIPICTDANGNISLLFTKRSPNLRSHVRQYSFPGGMQDKVDLSSIDCALRETEEEIGLHRSRVTVWGTGKLVRPAHLPAIMPVVGTIENFNIAELNINRDEVEEVCIVNIDELCASKKHTQFRVGSGYSAPVFVVNNGKTKIWGITGFITNMFLSCFLPNQLYNPDVEYIKPIKLS